MIGPLLGCWGTATDAGVRCSPTTDGSKMARRWCFVALGGWGDVAPVWSLAMACMRQEPSCVVVFLTHNGWLPWLRRRLSTAAIRLTLIGWDVPVVLDRTACTAQGIDESQRLLALVQHHRCSALVYNLYSCFGFHIAQAAAIPAVAVHPGWWPPDVKAPSQFWTAVLFSPVHSSMRQALGLPRLLPTAGQQTLPVPLLLGVSPALLSHADQAAHAHVLGYWFDEPANDDECRTSDHLGGLLDAFFSQARSAPVWISFGSMPMPRSWLITLGQRVSFVLRSPIVLVVPESEADERPVAVSSDVADWLTSNLLLLSGHDFSRHERYFPRARCLIHHGGSGTVHQAVKCGVPQVVIPQAYDQSFWASRVTTLGLGVTVSNDDVFPVIAHDSRLCAGVPAWDAAMEHAVTTLSTAVSLVLSSDDFAASAADASAAMTVAGADGAVSRAVSLLHEWCAT